jgi:dihydrofolate reductase
MERIIIAAMGANGVIGQGEGMPWHVPEEYAHYLRQVSGHAVIMGRRSWEIFGSDLTDTLNFAVSRSGAVKGAQAAPSLEEALTRAEGTGQTVFIAGGTSIYTQALERDWVDAMYLSTIHGDYTGDAFFPAWDEARWELSRHEPHTHFDFKVWRRRK